MANKKVKEAAKPEVEVDLSSIDPKILEALKKQAEEEAFERVCKAAGTTSKQIEELENKKPQPKRMIYYNIRPLVVNINGNPVPSEGIAPEDEVETILAAAGAKRNRLLEEKISKHFERTLLRDGNFQSRVVKMEDMSGLEISK